MGGLFLCRKFDPSALVFMSSISRKFAYCLSNIDILFPKLIKYLIIFRCYRFLKLRIEKGFKIKKIPVWEGFLGSEDSLIGIFQVNFRYFSANHGCISLPH